MMILKTAYQHKITEEFLSFKQARFDGQLICRFDPKLSLYLSYGGIFYAARSNSKHWLQKLLLHFPHLEGEKLLDLVDEQQSVDCWEYHLLFTLIESNKITLIQARQLIWVIVSETIYELWYSSTSSPEFYKSELKGLLVPPVTTFDPEIILSELRLVVEMFQTAKIVGSPFDLAPQLSWEKALPAGDAPSAELMALMNGRRTVWDLAAMLCLDIVSLVSEVISLKETGVLKLIPLAEKSERTELSLPPTLSLPESLTLPAAESANGASTKYKRPPQESLPTLKYFRVRIILLLGGVLFPLLLIGGFYRLSQKEKSLPVTVSAATAQNIQLYSSINQVPAPKGIFNYGGDSALTPLRSASAEILTRSQPQFRMRYLDPAFGNPGSRQGVSMVLDGILSFSLSGLPLTDSDYSKAKVRGFTLQQVPIAIDAIPFYTHPGVVIPGLSLNQLQSIFLGKIKNWNQVGGSDLPITPISIDPQNSTEIALLMQNVPGGASAVQATIVPDYSAALSKVRTMPGAISFGSFAALKGQESIRTLAISSVHSPSQYVPLYDINAEINTLAIQDGSYPLSHNLYVIYRRDSTDSEQAGIAYTNMMLSSEGQKLIENAGFIPLH